MDFVLLVVHDGLPDNLLRFNITYLVILLALRYGTSIELHTLQDCPKAMWIRKHLNLLNTQLLICLVI